jgi:hypothetical protein
VARNFQSDLQRGLAGQQVFAKIFKNAKHIDGKRGDLTINDAKIELKVDFYSMTKSPNFFMERYSSLEVLSAGGPWQAATHECPYFVYFYMQNMRGFVWKTADIVEQLNELENKLAPVYIRNSKWTTVGYKVDRNLLKPMLTFDMEGLYADNDKLVSQYAVDWGHAAHLRRLKSNESTTA